MWAAVAKEMHLPWRVVEKEHWQIGEDRIQERARRAVSGVNVADDRYGCPRKASLNYYKGHAGVPYSHLLSNGLLQSIDPMSDLWLFAHCFHLRPAISVMSQSEGFTDLRSD